MSRSDNAATKGSAYPEVCRLPFNQAKVRTLRHHSTSGGSPFKWSQWQRVVKRVAAR